MPSKTLDQLVADAMRKRDEIATKRERIRAEARTYQDMPSLSPDQQRYAWGLIDQLDAIGPQLRAAERDLEEARRERDHDAQLTRDAESRIQVGDHRSPVTSDDRQTDDGWIYADTSERADLPRERSIRSHPVFDQARSQRRGDEAIIGQHGTLGQLIRSLTTTGSSAIVPTQWAADFIDKVRNRAAVILAGATIVPMGAKTVNIGRLTGDPSVGFRNEGDTIVTGDPTFDNVTLAAKSLDGYVRTTREWAQDTDNGDELIVDALAAAVAQRIDLAALYGGITSGAGSINLPTPPNPRGVLAALQAVLPGNVLGGATNGTALTSTAVYNELIDAIFKVRDGNEEPSGIIYSTKLARQFAKAYDTTGQPIRMPSAVEDIPRYTSNQIPSYTQGTMANTATDAFVGDWSELLIGQRLDLQIEVNTQLFATTGEIAIFAHWRGDIQPARPAAFSVYRALGGAA